MVVKNHSVSGVTVAPRAEARALAVHVAHGPPVMRIIICIPLDKPEALVTDTDVAPCAASALSVVGTLPDNPPFIGLTEPLAIVGTVPSVSR